MSCITRIYRTETLRLCALARGYFRIMFVRIKTLQSTIALVRNFQIKVAFQMPIIEVGSSHDR